MVRRCLGAMLKWMIDCDEGEGFGRPFLLGKRRSGRSEDTERRRSLERVVVAGGTRLRRFGRCPGTFLRARSRSSGW
jgi:hypothetical protein